VKTETFVVENLTITPPANEQLRTTQSNTSGKSNRKDTPKT
jgi:hypothetical protein